MSAFSSDLLSSKIIGIPFFKRLFPQFFVLVSVLILSSCGGSSSDDDDQDSSEDPDPEEQEETPFVLMEATIESTHEALQSGALTCRGLVESYLNRISIYDKTTGINTVIRTNPEALDVADEIDQKLANGEPLGSMYCVPVLVKDLYDTYDMPTSGGNLSLAESVPPDDSYVIKVMREQDAIMLAKTNMDEFAFSAARTVSSLGGLTRNAYGLDRSSAGSSGGSAAGLAANFGLIATASDTGNSIRGPASHASLVGLRSTMGLISRDGVIPLILERDMSGVVTRTVEDTARVMNVIVGYDPADPITELSEGYIPEDYTDFLNENGLEGARLGVFRRLIDDSADTEVVTLFENAIDDLRMAGAEIVDDFDVPDYEAVIDGVETCFSFRYYFDIYLESLGPDAPVSSLEDLLENGQFSAVHAGSLRGALGVEGAPDEQDPPCVGEPGNIADNPGRQAFRDAVVAAMEDQGVDALIYPTWDNSPQPLGDNLDELPRNVGDNSQGLAPYSGQPAITVPMGFDADGLPLGLQIFGKPFAEGLLIQYAYAYEQATLHRIPPPLFPGL